MIDAIEQTTTRLREQVTGALPRSLAAAGTAALLAVGLGACEDPISVEDPDIVSPDALSSPTGLNAQRLGAFADFSEAWAGNPTGGGGTPGQILLSGLMTDEFKHSGTFPTRIQIDARRIQAGATGLSGFFGNLHRARRSAERTAAAYMESDSVEAKDEPIAEMMNLAGFTYVFFGENFCSGVPFSRVADDGSLEFGSGQTTAEMFNTAIQRFETARSRAESAGATSLAYASRIGQARALLNMGNFQDAADLVTDIETGFAYEIPFSTNSAEQENGVFSLTNNSERWSVVNAEGGGLAYLEAFTEGDPRTPWAVAPDSMGFDRAVLQLNQFKYESRSSPIALASGIEARLIEAEAALQEGSTGEFEQIHNDLRARIDSDAVGPVSADTMSQEQMVSFHFRERAFWLWLTGHRMGDARRLIRQYGRSEDEAFPSGSYFKPAFGTYGDQVVFPIPQEETNNPNFETCMNTSA